MRFIFLLFISTFVFANNYPQAKGYIDMHGGKKVKLTNSSKLKSMQSARFSFSFEKQKPKEKKSAKQK